MALFLLGDRKFPQTLVMDVKLYDVEGNIRLVVGIIMRVLVFYSLLMFSAIAMSFSFEDDLVLGPHLLKEECFDVAQGSRVIYGFTSQQSLKFDIHRHLNPNEVETLQSHRSVRRLEREVWKVEETGHYCLSWINRYNSVTKLTYQIIIESE